jgi:hypothetical protein
LRLDTEPPERIFGLVAALAFTLAFALAFALASSGVVMVMLISGSEGDN